MNIIQIILTFLIFSTSALATEIKPHEIELPWHAEEMLAAQGDRTAQDKLAKSYFALFMAFGGQEGSFEVLDKALHWHLQSARYPSDSMQQEAITQMKKFLQNHMGQERSISTEQRKELMVLLITMLDQGVTLLVPYEAELEQIRGHM